MSRKNKRQNKKQLTQMVSQIANDMTVNATSDNFRQRFAQFGAGGYDFADTMHNIYLDFGYPASLDFFNFLNMYKRFGIATSVIELYPDTCWSSNPEIKGSTQFNADLKKLAKRTKLFVRMKGLDIRQRVGRYGGMFMRVSDGKKLSEPLDGTFSENALVDMKPLYESQLEVIESDLDPTSPRFGLPIMYQLSGSADGSRNEDAVSTVNIHHTRVVIAAEGSDNGWIQGIPVLESIYNSLMDLRKIAGAGGEGFYKNAAQSVVFSLKDAASATANKDLLDKFNDSFDEFQTARPRKGFWAPGMDMDVLNSSLADPKNHFMNSLNDVAAGSKIPATILIGQQTGRLASSEDSESFLAIAQSRRETFLTDFVEDIINWMIKFGILPASDYEVEWDDLLARSDDEKLGNAEKMSTINERQFKSGQGSPFSGEEIREAAGFEGEEAGEIPSEEIDEEIDE